jgi:hypothetical protein
MVFRHLPEQGGLVQPGTAILLGDPGTEFEIDIVEHVGSRPNVIHANLHTGLFNHRLGIHRGAEKALPTSCDGFHRYRLNWTLDAITIGVDDRAYMQVRKSNEMARRTAMRRGHRPNRGQPQGYRGCRAAAKVRSRSCPHVANARVKLERRPAFQVIALMSWARDDANVRLLRLAAMTR